MMYSILCLALLGNTDFKHKMTDLELAIWQVESSQQVGPIWGDFVDGLATSCGPFQVSKNYFIDSKQPGKWPDAVFELESSVMCFRSYMHRWGYRIPDGMSFEEGASRLHNGGPNCLKATGQKKKNLDQYWSKVQKVLKGNK